MGIQLKGRRFGAVEDFQLFSKHLDFARGHIGVYRFGGAGADSALDLQHVFTAHLVGALEMLFGIGVKDHLNNAIAIPQIQEYNPAVVAASVYPAAQGYFLINMVLAE